MGLATNSLSIRLQNWIMMHQSIIHYRGEQTSTWGGAKCTRWGKHLKLSSEMYTKTCQTQ